VGLELLTVELLTRLLVKLVVPTVVVVELMRMIHPTMVVLVVKVV